MPTTAFKRGQTFAYVGQVKNNGSAMSLAGWSVAAQLRTKYGMSLVQALAASVLDASSGLVRIAAQAEETARWPLQALLLDIRLADPVGQVVISNTIEVVVVEQITNV